MQSERNEDSGQWSVVSGQSQSAANASRVTNPQPPTPSLQPRGVRRLAFTLTELLVVIAIIAVLAALVSVGVMNALATAKQTRIKTEVDQLDAAFKAYREKYGSFPPSDLTYTNLGRIQQHIARAFPRYDISKLSGDLQAAGITGRLRPDQALVFWLSGFSPDPANPFVTPGPLNPGDPVKGAQIIGGLPVNPTVKVAVPMFDFDPARLAIVDNTIPPTSGVMNNYGRISSYFPQGTKTDATSAPYVYWDAQSLPMANAAGPIAPHPLPSSVIWNAPTSIPVNVVFPNAGGIRPYAFDVNGNGRLSDPADPTKLDPGDSWVNPDSFQIISAGMDGRYGSLAAAMTDPARIYPTGTSTDPTSAISYDVAGGDDDNVTNFCPKARLGDSKP